jgi:hypothetical protein
MRRQRGLLGSPVVFLDPFHQEAEVVGERALLSVMQEERCPALSVAGRGLAKLLKK